MRPCQVAFAPANPPPSHHPSRYALPPESAALEAWKTTCPILIMGSYSWNVPNRDGIKVCGERQQERVLQAARCRGWVGWDAQSEEQSGCGGHSQGPFLLRADGVLLCHEGTSISARSLPIPAGTAAVPSSLSYAARRTTHLQVSPPTSRADMVCSHRRTPGHSCTWPQSTAHPPATRSPPPHSPPLLDRPPDALQRPGWLAAEQAGAECRAGPGPGHGPGEHRRTLLPGRPPAPGCGHARRADLVPGRGVEPAGCARPGRGLEAFKGPAFLVRRQGGGGVCRGQTNSDLRGTGHDTFCKLPATFCPSGCSLGRGSW